MKNLFAKSRTIKEPKPSKWNFKRKRERNLPSDYGGKIVRAAGGLYRFGPFTDTLETLKAYARTLKLECLKMGAISIKL